MSMSVKIDMFYKPSWDAFVNKVSWPEVFLCARALRRTVKLPLKAQEFRMTVSKRKLKGTTKVVLLDGKVRYGSSRRGKYIVSGTRRWLTRALDLPSENDCGTLWVKFKVLD